jgi:hypothetical protein
MNVIYLPSSYYTSVLHPYPGQRSRLRWNSLTDLTSVENSNRSKDNLIKPKALQLAVPLHHRQRGRER